MMDTKVRSDSPLGGKNRPTRVARSIEPLGWWYWLTAPAMPSEHASLTEREVARRGRLTSATLLVVILLVLAAYPIAFLGPNHILAFVLLIPLSIDMVALLLNRAGKITAAGYVVVLGIEVGVGLSILGPATSTGLTTYLLAQFDLLVQAEFVAVSLLRPRSVLWLAALHILLIVVGITFLPHTPEFSQIFAANTYEIFLRPITLQVIVAVVTYLWVTGAQEAIQRADRAEEIAALERREIERQEREIEEKQRLDLGIQQILQTHVEVANGNFSARAPLGKDNVLWQIAYSLNNLLARLQGYNQSQHELQRMKSATAYLVQAIHQARTTQGNLHLSRTGTTLDPLILELASYLQQSQARFPPSQIQPRSSGKPSDHNPQRAWKIE